MIIFYSVITILFVDTSMADRILEAVDEKSDVERIVFLSLVVWVSSILLMVSNNQIYQVIEGYRWPISKCDWLRRRELSRFEAMSSRFKELGKEWRAQGDRYPDHLKIAHDDLLREIIRCFPSSKFILPTRFGNATRAFEEYSRIVYGADSIPLWVHLSAVIEKNYLALIDDARSQVNFLLNIFVLSFLTLDISLLKILYRLLSLNITANGVLHDFYRFGGSNVMAIVIALFSIIACLMAYEFLIEKVLEWGTLVKAAFDCYLPDLALRLGYELPTTGDERRRFWLAVSRQTIFNRPIEPKDWMLASRGFPVKADSPSSDDSNSVHGEMSE